MASSLPSSAVSNITSTLEDRIELPAPLQNLPDSAEPGGHDEAVPGCELAALTGIARDDDPAREEMAELVLAVAHTPAPRRCLPHSSEKLLRLIRVVVPERQLRLTREQPLGVRRGGLGSHAAAEGYDSGHQHTFARLEKTQLDAHGRCASTH